MSSMDTDVKNGKNHSLTARLSFGYSFIILILLVILFAYNLYSVQSVQEEIVLSNNRTLSVYNDQINREFDDIVTYILQLQEQSSTLFQSADSQEQYFDKVHLYNDFNYTLLYQQMVNGFFVYRSEEDDFFYTHLLRNTKETYQQRIGIHDYLKSNIPEDSTSPISCWNQTKVGDTWYFIYQSWMNNICYGGWISSLSISNAVNPLPESDDNLIFLTLSEENIFPDSLAAFSSSTDLIELQNSKKYIVSTTNISGSDFTLSMLSKKKNTFELMNTTLKVFTFLSMMSILTIPFCHLFFKRLLYRPLQRTLTYVKKIELGDLDYSLPDNHTPREFQLLDEALYHMSQEIKDLKISVYEEQIQKKDIQLQQLQYQIKPHFILNIVNSISLMAQMNECSQIVETADYLSQYTRNMLNTDTSPNTLAEELEHLKNYLHLQELRFPEMITCHFSIPEEFMRLYIPTMMIHSFVENIFKHALDLYEPLVITIQAHWSESHDRDQNIRHAVFTIRDNGPGFPDKFLENFKSNQYQTSINPTKHIGIRNVVNRLYLSYGESASISLSNEDGAVVKIRIPNS